MMDFLKKRISFSDFFLFLFVFTVFSKELFSISVGGFSADLYGYSILTLSLFLFRPIISKKLLIIYLILVSGSFFSLLFLNLPFGPYIKQVITIFLTFFGTYNIMVRYKDNLNTLILTYINVAFISAIFGLVQLLLSYLGVNILIKVPLHLDSIAYEPSHYAAIIMPAVCISLFQFKQYRNKALVLVTALVLTKAFSAVVVLGVVLIIRYSKWYSVIPASAIMAGILFFTIQNYEHFAQRFYGMIDVYQARDYGTGTTPTGTAASFASNLDVAIYTVKQSPTFGSGFGGHETMYERRFAGTLFAQDWFYQLNRRSAHSLTIRILSELGLLGFLGFIVFILTHWVKKKSNYYHYVISLACISHFLCKSLKLGGYIDYGTPFFFCLLIVNLAVFKSKFHSLNEN